jgi:ribosomal protein L39E
MKFDWLQLFGKQITAKDGLRVSQGLPANIIAQTNQRVSFSNGRKNWDCSFLKSTVKP